MRSDENSNNQKRPLSFYDVFHKIENELNNLYEKSMICFSNDTKPTELKLQKFSNESFSTKQKV